MKHVLKNQDLTVTLSSLGAEVVSVTRGDCEYVWQGNPTYWKGQSPLMFPICGRFVDQTYTHGGKTYQMGTHGFARHADFVLASATDTCAVFVLESNDDTRAQYPFDFVLTVTYTLEGSRLTVAANIRNTGAEILPAAFGGHPGFNVPLDGKGEFADWYLEFAEDCSPDEILMSPACFITGKRRAYPLKDGKIFPLRHDLFMIDGIFMARMADTVTLKSDLSERSVTLHYPQMPYLGVWHAPRTDAPYVCVEPWCSLPAYDGECQDITQKPDMFRILPGRDKDVSFSISFQ